jgi:chlorophyll synthase
MNFRASIPWSPFARARLFWYLECWGLKRIDAWGVGYIVCALALVMHDALTLQTFLLMVMITTNYWLGYWLNDYFDVPYDRKDQRKARFNIFLRRQIPRTWIWGIVALTFTVSTIPFLWFGWHGMIILLISYGIMWAYSAPPIRLKSRPGFDLLTHALFIQSWPYAICIWLTGTSWTLMDTLVVSICFLASLNGQLRQQIRDFAVDSQTDTNFTTSVGLTGAIIMLRVFTLGMIVLSVLALLSGNIPWLFVPLGLLGVPKVIHQMLLGLRGATPTFSRRMTYITMLLALIYTNVLIVWKGAL